MASPLDVILGMGYSGYAVLRGVPLLLLPSGTPENENLILSEGAYNSDPAFNVGQLPARQKRSVQISFNTTVSPRTWPLLKALTYGWRFEGAIDFEPEIPFVYILASGEGFEGYAHVDDVSISAEPESLMTMAINLTSWVWAEIGSSSPLTKFGTPILSPFFDSGYRPVAGWNNVVLASILGTSAIVQRFSLKLVNNWNYQTFLAGYLLPPQPALVTAGALDVSLELAWVANRRDRPLNSGAFQISIGGDSPSNALDTIYLDRMVRNPRAFEGGGSPNQVIQWSATYFLQGAIPRSG